MQLEKASGLCSRSRHGGIVSKMGRKSESPSILAIEMDERLDGTWQPADGDEELQRRFWSMYEGSDLHGKLLSRIGAEFLRQSRELLE